jgi:hypothetical protein
MMALFREAAGQSVLTACSVVRRRHSGTGEVGVTPCPTKLLESLHAQCDREVKGGPEHQGIEEYLRKEDYPMLVCFCPENDWRR